MNAVEAVAKASWSHWNTIDPDNAQPWESNQPWDRDAALGEAEIVLAFIRDAIRADGETGDAVREALGLKVQTMAWDCSCGGVGYVHHTGFATAHEPLTTARRLVGEWQGGESDQT